MRRPTELPATSEANTANGDGSLSSAAPANEPPDRYTYDPENPTPSAPFANGRIDGPRDVRANAGRADILSYTTPPLAEEVVVVGPITAKLFVASSARDTDWMVRLMDVHPDGMVAFLAEGLMRARHRDPKRDGAFNAFQLSPLEPNAVHPYIIEFWRPTGNAFAKGHRIRVEISSSYFPYYLRNLNTGEDNTGLDQTRRRAPDHPPRPRPRVPHRAADGAGALIPSVHLPGQVKLGASHRISNPNTERAWRE